MDEEIDDIEEMKRWIATVVQNAKTTDAERLKLGSDAMLAGASQIGGVLQNRCTALARQCRPRKSKPPKSAPVNGPQKQGGGKRNTDSPDTSNDSEGSSKGLSAIQQGIRQADPSLVDQQRALRGKVYGAQNPDVAFQKAAQAIAR